MHFIKLSTRQRFTLACLAVILALASAQHSDEDPPDAGEDGLHFDREESRNLRPRAYTPSAYSANTVPSGFRPTPSLAELAGYQHQQQTQHLEPDSYLNIPTIPARAPPQQQLYVSEEPRQPTRSPHRKHQEQRIPVKLQKQQLQEAEEELEEEKEEPDRLSELLQQSKFDCSSKQTGYYADEELACEVFHYCQENVKHSWICPEGFTFHQVHLICMPPTSDNICQKSSKYHFVNEYLYRPINQEEVQRKPNVSLKYSDRYYPSDIYLDDRYDEESEEDEKRPAPADRASARVQQQTTPSQVFRSAEEVNIPLVHRRPQRPYDFDF